MNPLNIVIIIFIIVLVILLLKYILADPYTLQSMQNGKTSSVIESSSLATSNNSGASTNFAYSIWFYVNDWNYRYGEPKVIFGRMAGTSTAGSGNVDGINGVDPCPAVVLDAIENNISVSLACFPGDEVNSGSTSNSVHTCSVSNVPIQKWVNLIISVYGRSMDIYIDGKLVKTCLLPGVANVKNDANIFVTPSGGFDGWTSKFQYYPSPLNPQEAWNIYTKGFSSWYSNMFSSYNIQVSLVENGATRSTLTL